MPRKLPEGRTAPLTPAERQAAYRRSCAQQAEDLRAALVAVTKATTLRQARAIAAAEIEGS
jgi:hypothetical protein